MITKIINKYKELISYGFWGVITTILHILLFYILTKIGIKYYIANIITLITIKTIAYIDNKIFVFKTKCKNKRELFNEIFKYILSRLFTMVLDYFGLILLVEVLHINELLGKIIILILVVIINYYLCKLVVYKKEVIQMNKVKNILEKVLNFVKKHWFILTILFICIARFLFTYKLPNFYLYRMEIDDNLYIRQVYSLIKGKYLGDYNVRTLIKGPVYAFVLMIAVISRIGISSFMTLLYTFSCLYFLLSLKNVIKNKKYLIIIFFVLMFNPVTISSDLFQRLYRNSISITEFLFFFGAVIRIVTFKDKKILNNILLGIFTSLMFLTREDNIWVYPILLFLIIYSIFKDRKIKTIFICLIPIIVLTLSLNIVSLINYKYYGIYTYNEIHKSEFHNTYKKILQIKDDDKIHMVSIPKSTLYKLSDYTKTFNLTREEIDDIYDKNQYYEYEYTKDEIYNGNMIWYIRTMIGVKNNIKTGKQSEELYKKLGEEIDQLFENGTFEKEFVMPSTNMAVPTKEDFVALPGKLLDAIIYTTTYKDIKTLTKTDGYSYNKNIKAYFFDIVDYHDTANIVKNNPIQYEINRIIFMVLTIILSIVSLVIYFRNILKFDSISIISHLLMISYLLIIGGVTYTHISSFNAIRPLYLGNVYIIQSLFIIFNMYRVKDNILKK